MASEKTDDESEVPYVEAQEVFLLMKKNTRVSRNIRACWFFRNLQKTLNFTPPQELHLEDLTQDLTLAWLIPSHGNPIKINQTYNVGINTRTIVNFLASRYRLAFTLDLSASVMTVDVMKGRLVCEEIFQNFSNCLRALVKPFLLPGSHLQFAPKLFITVMAYSPVVHSAANQVMLQGVSVSRDNVDMILQYVQTQLSTFQDTLTGSFAKVLEHIGARRTESNFLTEEDETNPDMQKVDESLATPEAGFVDMLRCGILALQMLPENSSSGIVIVTDGLVGVPESSFLESLLTQLRNSTISCSFLKVGSSLNIQHQLGHVPYTELMQFIAMATFGGYFSSCPDLSQDESQQPNIYHQAMFYWSFQKGVEGFIYMDTYDEPKTIGSPSWIHKQLYSHPLYGSNYGQETLHKKHLECTVQATLNDVLSVRLREGYTIKEVNIRRGGTEIEVKLVLPWRDYGKIEYITSAVWPLEKNKSPSKVEINIEGSYDFLHEITCIRGKKVNSPFRISNTKKFWHMLQNISQTDQLLTHLQSFDSNPVFYEVPESIRSGVPLFTLDAVNPVLNSQLNTKESTLTQFASFWKPVMMLDTNIWQKWVHSHRIGLVMEQDLPLPKYLHVPNSSGRYNILQCRQAFASLTQLLRGWATFVMAENHSYIKFLSREPDKPPSYFCLLRLTSKPPSVILRLAFLGGTPSCLRRQEIQALKEELVELKFPQRYIHKSDKKTSLKVTADNGKEKERKAPLLREWSEINCCTVLRKPVEKILIRYDQKPEDVEDRSFSLSGGEVFGAALHNGISGKLLHSKFNTLSHYLMHHRWIWSVQRASSVPVALNTIAKMLQTLTKIRLQEGFHFAFSNSGICNMVLEVDMMDSCFTSASESKRKEESYDEHQTCVVQYLVFPPHSKTSRGSVSEEDLDEMATTEADGEVQIVTECWIEPQFGVCINNTPERSHFEGLTSPDLAEAFFPVDYECVSSLTTFNHLIFLCENSSDITSLLPDISQSGQSSPPSTPRHRHVHGRSSDDGRRVESTVSFIPFPFDLLTLLPRSQQAELLFSTFVVPSAKSTEQEVPVDPKGSNELLFSLLCDKFREIHNREENLTSQECSRFLELMGKRMRDLGQNPFPFQHTSSGKNPAGTAASFKGKDRQDTDGGETTDTAKSDSAADKTKPYPTADHCSTSPTVTTASTILSDMTPKTMPASSLPGLPQMPIYPDSNHSLPPRDCDQQPVWKCYIKATSTSHLLFTFMPASYDDLLLLNHAVTVADDNSRVEAGAGSAGLQDNAVNMRSLDSAGGKAGEMDGSALGKTITAAAFENVTDGESTGAVSMITHVSREDSESCVTGTSVGERMSSLPLSVSDKIATVITVTEASPCHSPERAVLHSREEDIKEWVKSSPTVPPPVKGPMTIPIYVYDCMYYNVVESLINRWTFSLPEDIFEDLRFFTEESQQPPIFTRNRLSSFDAQASAYEEKDEGEFSRSGWRTSLDRRSESVSEGVGDFKQHCQLLTETFFSCFVTGLYQSLRHNFNVDKHDIDAAISNICEETVPLEIDITSFLLASCGHLQHLASQGRKDVSNAQESDMGPRKPSVRFMEIVEIKSDDGHTVIPEILQLPKCMVPLRPTLFADNSCEYAEGLQKMVQDTFLSIVQHWFQPIASLPDTYFFCPAMLTHSSLGGDADDGENKGDESDGHFGRVGTDTDLSLKGIAEDDEGDIIMADFIANDAFEDKEVSLSDSLVSNMENSMSDFDLDESQEAEEKELVPLFLNFTCTLKRRTEHHNISVTTIPQCLGDLLKKLESPLLALDFADFKVTLDINCLTLPSDFGNSSFCRPSLLRMLSGHSESSEFNHSQMNEREVDDVHSTGTSTDYDETHEDPLGHLPRVQHEAVTKFREEVEWLLRDEIVSALRHLQPLNADALEFVTQHVRSSFRLMRPSSVHEKVSLQFVFGPDRSMKYFIEEFEHISIPGYKLCKKMDFYVLVIDRAHADSIRHAQALKSALAELSREDATQKLVGLSPSTLIRSKLFPSMEERSYSMPNILPTAELSPINKLPDESSDPVIRAAELSPLNKLPDESSDPIIRAAECEEQADDGRVRSCSDAKFMDKTPAVGKGDFSSGCEQEPSIPPTTVPQKPLLGDVTIEGSDALIRKSNSFAGLQGQMAPISNSSPIISEGQLGPLSPFKQGQLSYAGLRSRHFSAPSGQGTPQSRTSTLPQTPSIISSHGSGTSDAGFEGDVSDADMDDTVSISDAGVICPHLPNFWLIMQIHKDRVELDFHSRESTSEGFEKIKFQQRALLSRTIQSIQDICVKINKQLLLHELYESRMCNALLVPEADEDVNWTDRRTISGRSVQDASELEDEDDSEEGQGRGYLAAAMNFEPGFFACACMWRKVFFMHPRLKAGAQRGGMTRGVGALRGVLNKFSVNNRKNMFVIKEVSSGNVFYLRVREIMSSNSNVLDIQADLEYSYSELSLQKLKENSKADAETRSEGDAVSLMSGFSRMSSRVEDMVELTVHGIEDPGKEIQEDLMKLLQSKLDDTVLDVITVMLSRNPQCKLRFDDVQFIQNIDQNEIETVQLTIPSHAMLYLSALLFYLRQNLLQFLHSPNYQEDTPDCHFHDYILGTWTELHPDQVYIYLSPQLGGRKGMACVSCSLVDGCGNPVKLLSCPRPSRQTTTSVHNIVELFDMVETSVHDASTTSWGPGPTALIQFRIWHRGSVDQRQLRDKLMASVTYAISDVIMEFSLLTAPICIVPRYLQDFKAMPITSLPSSPVTVKKEPERKHPPLTRKLSDSMRSLGIRPVPQSASPFQALREAFSPRTKIVTPTLETSHSFDWSQDHTHSFSTSSGELPPPSPLLTPSSCAPFANAMGLGSEYDVHEMQDQIQQYEKGEKGSLHPVYASVMEPWLQFCHKKGMPAVSRIEANLLSDFSVEYILHELLSSLTPICSRVSLKVFKVLHYSNPESSPISIQFTPCKIHSLSVENQMENAIDSVHSEIGTVKMVTVGRDYDQWSNTVQWESVDFQPSHSAVRPFQEGQKFNPFWIDAGKEKAKDSNGSLFGLNQTFIPRQQMIFVYAYNKKMTVYTYNWASDLMSILEKTVTRLVQWHNARTHVISSILSQKMGLFHHNAFADLSHDLEENPYTQSTNEVDNLIRHTAPPRDVHRRNSSMSLQSRSISRMLNQYRPFDDTYKNLQPYKPLQRTSLKNHIQDPVSKHGMQALEIRTRYRKDGEQLMRLQQLYLSWWQKNNTNPPVSEDYLQLLKQSSRLFHYCATPLLFCSRWRQQVLQQNTAPTASVPMPSSPEREPVKSRSRHGSGASVSSGRVNRSESVDGVRAKKAADSMTTAEGSGQKTTGLSPEEVWHRELCHSFLMQYRNYLTSEFGFICLNLQPGMSRKMQGRSSSEDSTSGEESSRRYMTVNLQKTMTGGIILIELSLRGQFFVLKMFVSDCLLLGVNTNQQMQLLFVDECEKYKDLIHVHSFAHDFHLRCVHSYLSGNPVFHPNFHLGQFLSEFLQIYVVPPSFARNCLAQETVLIRELPCPGFRLFDYMHNQMRHFSMSSLRMSSAEEIQEPEYYFIQADEFALVQTQLVGILPNSESEVYNMALVITQDTPRSMENMTLKIKFFVVLTRQRDCHPKRTLEKKFGDFRNAPIHRCTSGSSDILVPTQSGEPGLPVAVKQHLGVRQEHTNYLGYSNIHLARLYTLLSSQIQAGREKIEEMVQTSKVKCRRDYLWQRMSVATKDDNRKRSRQEDNMELGLMPLTFTEFGELLKLVSEKPLSEVDPQLSAFTNMPASWYAGLISVLSTRFTSSCRFFTNAEGSMQHVVVLNSSWLDMFILLTVDQNSGCSALSQVTREPCIEEEYGEKQSLVIEQMHTLIEDFVNACCYHLWTTLL